jgi:hypothetical protein
MNEQTGKISGAITYWVLEPTPYDAARAVFEDMGYGKCMPNPRTDHSALTNSIKEVYGTKNRVIVSRKKSKQNGVELVDIGRETDHNSYQTHFGAKVVGGYNGTPGQVRTDYGYANDDLLTEQFLKSKAMLTASALSNALAAVLAIMDQAKGVGKAGIFYVPEDSLDAWKALAKRIEGCSSGNRITTWRAVMDEEAVDTINAALTKEVLAKSNQLLEDIHRGTLKDEQLESRREQAEALMSKVDRYADILGLSQAGLKEVVGLVQSAAAAAIMQDFAGSMAGFPAMSGT